jgi:hypothetical protein
MNCVQHDMTKIKTLALQLYQAVLSFIFLNKKSIYTTNLFLLKHNLEYSATQQ